MDLKQDLESFTAAFYQLSFYQLSETENGRSYRKFSDKSQDSNRHQSPTVYWARAGYRFKQIKGGLSQEPGLFLFSAMTVQNLSEPMITHFSSF